MTTLTALFMAASIQFELPPHVLEALCYVESKHDVNAVHYEDGGSNSVGVCQIKLVTAQWLGFKGTEADLLDPKINIYYAAKYLARNYRRYKGDIVKAVIAYNKGSAGLSLRTAYSDKVFNQWRVASNEQH